MPLLRILAVLVCLAFAALINFHPSILAKIVKTAAVRGAEPVKKINFVSTSGSKRTPNPPGWEAYDGSPYTRERGYGWLSVTDLLTSDGGPDGPIILPGGRATSSRELGRLELSNFHATGHPAVFRIDLPNGWYRVHCASVAHSILPVIDERTFKCRAHDRYLPVLQYGSPLKIRGRDLVEGSNSVEVTDGHLRIVVGDPAYGGWTWSYKGPWYRGWSTWWGEWGDHRYAKSWYQKFTRVIDPAFHMLRLNALRIERVAAPAKQPGLFFRDFFNRDDNPDINAGIAEVNWWVKVGLNPAMSEPIGSQLYKTSLKLTAPKNGKSQIGVIQQRMSPEKGTIRYATRVSLFTGEGGKIHSGFQEAGLLILGEANAPTEFNSTFIGVGFDHNRAATRGFVTYRVGNGQNGYKTNLEISDTSLPFQVTEGEHELVVDHDVKNNVLKRIQINGQDLTAMFSVSDRTQRVPRGLFGIRASMDSLGSGVRLQQFYWYYRVEDIARIEILPKSELSFHAAQQYADRR